MTNLMSKESIDALKANLEKLHQEIQDKYNLVCEIEKYHDAYEKLKSECIKEEPTE